MFGIENDFMKENSILVQRGTHTLKSVIGSIYLGKEAKRFSYSLEDVIRGRGIKIAGNTGIPEGTYFWHITYSNRFKRNMISIYTQPNGYELRSNDISFKGLRIHGGNTHLNTEGCLLVAFNKINDETIQGTAEKELLEWAQSVGGKGLIEFKNK